MAYRPVEGDELRDLVGRAQSGDAGARNEMVERNIPLVRSIARKYANGNRSRHSDRADIVQDGFLGLIRAVDKFDLGRGTKFSTYATQWIRSRILDGLRRRDSPIYVASYLRYPPRGKAIAERYAAAARAALRPFVSLDASDYDFPDREAEAEGLSREEFDTVRKAIDCLDARERMIVTRYYGVHGDRETLAAIAAEQGCDRWRLRMEHRNAINKMLLIYARMR